MGSYEAVLTYYIVGLGLDRALQGLLSDDGDRLARN